MANDSAKKILQAVSQSVNQVMNTADKSVPPEGTKSCPNCGHVIVDTDYTEPMEVKTVKDK